MSEPVQEKKSAGTAPGTVVGAALIVTAIEGIETTASALAEHLRLSVEIASTRSAALRLLGRRSYAIVMMDQMLAEADPEGADLLWKNAGVAIPLQVSFALAGEARVEREVRAALARRARDQQLAQAAAAAALDVELKNAVTGFLLESQLALAEEGIPPRVEARLRTLEGLANSLRTQLAPTDRYDTTVVLPVAQG